MAGGTKVSELTVTMDPSAYEAGAARVVAADDKVSKSAASMGDAVQKAGASVDAAGAKISSVDQRVTGTVSSFERLERSLRTQAGTAQLYQQAVDRVNATVAKHPELASRAADVISSLGDRYLGTGKQIAAAAKEQQAAQMAAAAAAQTYRDKIDPASAALRAYQAETTKINGLVAAGALTQREGALAIEMAAAARAAETAAVAKAGEAYAETSIHAGALVRESRAIFDELSSGRSKQAIGSITLLLTRGLGLGFGPVAGAAAALAIPAAVLLSTEQYAESLKRIDLALATTGRQVGITRDGLLDLARATSQASGVSSGQGRSIVETLAASGNAGAGSIERAAALSRDFGAAMGKDAVTGAQLLAQELAKPSQGLAELDKRFGIASVALVEYVRRTEASGNAEAARAAVLDALAPKLQGLADKQLTTLGERWKAVGDFASDAWDRMGHFGADETLLERIERLQRALAQLPQDAAAPPDWLTNITPGRAAARNAAFHGQPQPLDRSALQSSLFSSQIEYTEASTRASVSGSYSEMRSIANRLPDIAKDYDGFGRATEDLKNRQEDLAKTLASVRITGQAVGDTFNIVARGFDDDADALRRRQDPANSPQARALRSLDDQSSILSLSPGQRGLASNALSINERYDALRLTPVEQRPNQIGNDDLEVQRNRELALATAQYTTSIRDQTVAMTMRTQATLAYAEAMSKPGLSPAEAMAAGAGAQARSAGIEAAYGTGQNTDVVRRLTLQQQAAAGLASVTEATTRLRMETDLLSQSDSTNAATLQASNRDRETEMLLFGPLATAAANYAAAVESGDAKAIAKAAAYTEELNKQKDAYARLASDRDQYNAVAQAAKIGGDLNDQLQMAQLRASLQPQLTSTNPDDRVAAARSIAELQEQLALVKQFGPDLDAQDQTYIKIAGDIAAINEAIQNANQQGKSWAKIVDETGNAGGRMFEQLATGTGTWSNRVHQALTSFEQDVANIITKIAVLQPLEAQLGGGSSGGSGLSSFLGGLISSYFGGSDFDVGDSAYNGGAGSLSYFGGPRAAGGGVDPSATYLVGEEGPELFNPGSSGTIIPAAQTAAMMNGGGGGDTNFHIYVPSDSGVTIDQVRRVVNEAAPNLIKAASMHAQKQVFGQIQRGGAASKVSGRRPLA